MKKALSILLVLVLCLGTCMAFAGCGETTTGTDKADVKVGFIFLHDENSTYDKNFMDAAKLACEEMGVEYAQKTQIPESNKCYDAAVELIEV
ncbi:MAG: BMP family ABC transporter substrate-binding protein, partial [Ruminococcus sp.]|nr:BMP family ABC transporter substrate-binding protein [Ruminococcus sp.]